jgi:hypothetical protein
MPTTLVTARLITMPIIATLIIAPIIMARLIMTPIIMTPIIASVIMVPIIMTPVIVPIIMAQLITMPIITAPVITAPIIIMVPVTMAVVATMAITMAVAVRRATTRGGPSMSAKVGQGDEWTSVIFEVGEEGLAHIKGVNLICDISERYTRCVFDLDNQGIVGFVKAGGDVANHLIIINNFLGCRKLRVETGHL